MKQNCDPCTVTPPATMKAEAKTKVDPDENRGSINRSSKYLMTSTKHCSSVDSPPLKAAPTSSATNAASALLRTIPSAAAAATTTAVEQQPGTVPAPYHHLHHHQFNGFDEYYSAPLLAPALMMDMMLAAHLLRGYYQPAGPMISSHPPGSQSPLKSKADPSAVPGSVGPPPPVPHPVHQPTPSVGLVEHHRLDTGDSTAASELHRSQAFRYIPQPPGPYARPPIHQMHCTYPPPPPSYYGYGQHPQDLCYPPSPYSPYYPQKMYATPSPYRRYMSGSYYQAGDLYDPQSSSRLPPPPPQPVPGHPPTLEQYPYYAPYASASAAQCYGRAVSYLDSAPPPGSGGGAGGSGLPPPLPYPSSCPCPMQSCPKNVHTGPLIGSSKGPGQPNTQHQQPLPNQGQAGGAAVKTEAPTENYPKQNTVHYESTVNEQTSSGPDYTLNTLEPEMSVSPARGSTGLTMPTTPVSPSISEVSGSSGSAGGARKARIGKNSVREQQLMMSNGNPQQPGAATIESMYAQELPPHLQHYHHEMMYNPNLYAPHYDQRYPVPGQPTYYHHLPPQRPQLPATTAPPQQPLPQAPKNNSKEDECYVLPVTVKQEPIIKTERLEVKQELMSGDDEEPALNLKTNRVAAKVAMAAEVCDTSASVVTKPNINRLVESSEDPSVSDSKSTSNSEDSKEVEVILEKPARKSLLKLSPSTEKSGPKKSNYKKLIRPAEPKPYLSCAAGAALKRGDKLRKKYSINGDRLRMRMIRRHRRNQVGSTKVQGIRRKSIKASTSKSRGKVLVKRAKKRPEALNESTSSEDSMPVDASQDRNNNNTDKELNNNKLSVAVTEEVDEGHNSSGGSHLDETIDLVARGHFDAVEVTEDEDAEEPSPSKKLKVESAPAEVSPGKSKGKKKSADKSCAKKSNPVDRDGKKIKKAKQRKPNDAAKVNELELTEEAKVPARPKAKAAKKSKTGKKSTADQPTGKDAAAERVSPMEVDDVVAAKSSVPEPVVEMAKKATQSPKDATVLENKKCDEPKGQSPETDPVQRDETAPTVPEKELATPTSVVDPVQSTTSVAPAAKGRPGRKPKKGGLKLSSRKRKNQQRLSKALEEVPIKKHVGAPRWSNGWNWLGDSFQGLVFLNSDDPPVMRTCYHAMKHMEGDIIRPRDCVLLRAGSKRNELPYVAKVAHLWENPEDGEMMMSLLWYYRPEHTEQGRQEADGAEEVFASKHKDHNSVACIEDKCYVLTFNEYCRYRRILKGVEENIDVPPSLVPAVPRPDQEGMLAPKVPLNTSPELVMFCHRVYEFRFKRMKNFY